MTAATIRDDENAEAGPRRVRRYVRAVGWLIRDGLEGEVLRVVLVVAASGSSVVAMGMSLLAVFSAAARAEAGEPLSLFGRELGPAGPRELVIVAVVALLVGLLSQVCYLLAELQVHALGRAYNLRCVRRVLEIATRPDADTLFAGVVDREGRAIDPARLASVTGQHCGYALLFTVQSVLPLMVVVVAIAALLWIDPVSTLIVSPLVAIYAVPIVLVNRRVSRYEQDTHRIMPRVFRRIRRWLGLVGGSGPGLADPGVWRPALLGDGQFDRLGVALYGRLLAHSKISFINSVLVLTCVCVVLVVAVVRGGATLTSIVAFLVALRFAGWGLRLLTGSQVVVHRFLHEFEAMGTLVRRARQPAVAPPPLASASAMRVDPWPGDGSVDTVEIAPGRLALCLVASASPAEALRRAGAVFAERGPAAVHRLALAELMTGVTIAEQTLGREPSPPDREALEAVLARLGALDAIEKLPRGIDTVNTAGVERRLGRAAVIAVAAAPLAAATPAVVLLGLQRLLALEPDAVATLLEVLAPHAVVLVGNTAEPILRPKQATLRAKLDPVLVVNGENAVHGGSPAWFAEHADAIEAMLAEVDEDPDEPVIVDVVE